MTNTNIYAYLTDDVAKHVLMRHLGLKYEQIGVSEPGYDIDLGCAMCIATFEYGAFVTTAKVSLIAGIDSTRRIEYAINSIWDISTNVLPISASVTVDKPKRQRRTKEQIAADKAAQA